ncbi:HWE histidine kinase domain-containing protein [Bradyrhizobium sp.]|uniref:sensor histidine kinase n=1 Tax=Bradyrhizobium sp. TaxID=376 RepID=UPI00262AF614|nr:HWE histidine kinase domain-containing protein [Bradyrhizobium sp.]
MSLADRKAKPRSGSIIIDWLKIPTAPRRAWLYFLLFGGAYSVLCIFGVRTANDNVLSLIWPANPFMLGMLVRFPFLARPLGWVACAAGFAIAIPIMGCGLATAAGLATYNFGVVVIGYVLLYGVDQVDQRLKRLTSVFYLLFAVVAESIFAGIVGPILIGPLFHDPAAVGSYRYWFSVELLNQLAFLPMILSYPEGRKWWRRQLPQPTFHDQAPIIALVLSATLGIFFGEMGALTFPVPALLWCAISYRVFLTAVLTFIFCIWVILATTLSYNEASHVDQLLVLSISMGAALISLGPVIISTTTATRNEIVDQLRRLAAEREIVANELDHRIKNLFALVNGLISLSVRGRPEMRPLADTLRNRLVALRRAHSLIHTGNALSGPGEFTSLRELIGVLLRPYESAENKHFIVDGDEVCIDRGTLAAMALIFHELATNSTKYGALNDPDGALSVHISRGTDDLRIKWIERVAVKMDCSNAMDGGFGSKLLDFIINQQLQGSYARTCTEAGMDIEIILPNKLFSDPPSNPLPS